MIYILSLVGPFFLLLVEKILPLPFIVEEIYKYLVLKLEKVSSKQVFLLGLLFSFSESVFYFFNPEYQNNLSKMVVRLLVVTPMHISTMLLMNYFNKYNKISISLLGILLAAFIHFLFNSLKI